jgi:hypothetical protein
MLYNWALLRALFIYSKYGYNIYMRKIFTTLSLIVIFFITAAPSAVTPTGSSGVTPVVETGGTAGTVSITNPLGVDSLQAFIGKLINGVLGIIGSLALVMFVYGGFTWMTSMGNPTAIKKGKDTMLWAALGLTVIFSAYTLASFVINSVAGGS